MEMLNMELLNTELYNDRVLVVAALSIFVFLSVVFAIIDNRKKILWKGIRGVLFVLEAVAVFAISRFLYAYVFREVFNFSHGLSIGLTAIAAILMGTYLYDKTCKVKSKSYL